MSRCEFGTIGPCHYTYDDASRVGSKESLWRNNTTTQFIGTSTFSYDNDDQLTGENRDYSVNAMWQYDESGNRVAYSNGPYFGRSYTTTDDNRIDTDGTFTYTHDAEGNITAKGNSNTRYEYEWDWRDRLTTVRLYINWGSGLALYWTIHYGYDAFDQPVWRSIANTTYNPTYKYYSFEGGQMNLAFEYYGMLTQRFVWGPQTDQLLIDELDSAAYGTGQIYYPLADQQQSIIDAAKYIPSAGATKMVTHRVNDAYSTGGSYSTFEGVSFDGSLFAYTGRFLDNMTGLQWHTARWYDPNLGRWLSEDPIGFNGDPWNLYRYVGNSPTNRIDPSGLDFIASGSRFLDIPFKEKVKGRHYSLEYWCFKTAAPKGEVTRAQVEAAGGKRLDQVQLFASSGWKAAVSFTAIPDWGPVEGVASVSIAYIIRTSTAATLLAQKDGATTADWKGVIAAADSYLWAEHPAAGMPAPPFKNWPHSNYAMLGTNSNVFIRWLVKTARVRSVMIEMSGLHPPSGVSEPHDNLPPFPNGKWIGTPHR